MFDLGAGELLVIVVVAIVVIGPKDLPLALRTAGRWMGKLRRMSNHFRTGLDAMIREAEMEDMEQKWKAQNEKIMREHPADAPPEVERTGALPSSPRPPEVEQTGAGSGAGSGAEAGASRADATPAPTPGATQAAPPTPASSPPPASVSAEAASRRDSGPADRAARPASADAASHSSAS